MLRTPEPPRRSRRAGFTVVELVLVVAILGVLAATAAPGYRKLTLRAKRAEAYAGLKGLHTAQTAYFAEHDRYGRSAREIGFELEGGEEQDDGALQDKSYRFETGALPRTGRADRSYWASATADLIPGDGVLDVLVLEPGVTVVEP